MNTNQLKKFAQAARVKLIEQVTGKLNYVLTHDTAELRGKAETVRKLKEEILNGKKENITLMKEIILKGDENAEKVKVYMKELWIDEAETIKKSLDSLGSKMIKKEDLQKCVKEAMESSMKSYLNQLESLDKKITAIANHQDIDSFNMKESIKDLLESLTGELEKVGKAQAGAKTSLETIAESIGTYKGKFI